MIPVRELFLSAAGWVLAGTLAFASGVAIELPRQTADCGTGCAAATFPYTAGGRGR